MTHPLLLHFRAASWSLNSARGALAQRAREEAEAIAAEEAEGTNDGLRSSVMGVRNGGGGHGDPVSGVALAGLREPRPNRFQQLADSVTGTLRWLAVQIDAAHQTRDPLLCLMDVDLRPATAGTVTRWLDENDRRIRDVIGLHPHLWALPGAECPRCRTASLYVQTAAPSHLWTVVCRLGCLCSGEGCPCLMPVRVEGVAHVWDRSAPLVESALTPVVAGHDTRTPNPTADTTQPAA